MDFAWDSSQQRGIINRHPKLQIVLNGQMGITLYVVRRYDGLCLDLDIEILDVSGPSLITDKSDCADFGLDLDICHFRSKPSI